jgi:hypothetical protein
MPSKLAAAQTAALEQASGTAWAQIIAAKFFTEFFIAMYNPLTALYPCL